MRVTNQFYLEWHSGSIKESFPPLKIYVDTAFNKALKSAVWGCCQLIVDWDILFRKLQMILKPRCCALVPVTLESTHGS